VRFSSFTSTAGYLLYSGAPGSQRVLLLNSSSTAGYTSRTPLGQ
jgi:hypothetical protein